jgi:hypothetical protein
MKRINQMRLYRLGNLTRLRELREGDQKSLSTNRYYILIQLKAFIDDTDNQATARAAVERARLLWDVLQGISSGKLAYDQGAINLIEQLLTAFETSLNDDLARLPTYVVELVGAYSFDQLINHADAVFPETFRNSGLIPDLVLTDFRAAGACLAFDLPLRPGQCNRDCSGTVRRSRPWARTSSMSIVRLLSIATASSSSGSSSI